MSCAPQELVRWFPSALPGAQLQISEARGECVASFVDGVLRIVWQTLPPRRLAPLELPQLRIRFAYEGFSDTRRVAIQRSFDLATHRGGG